MNEQVILNRDFKPVIDVIQCYNSALGTLGKDSPSHKRSINTGFSVRRSMFGDIPRLTITLNSEVRYNRNGGVHCNVETIVTAGSTSELMRKVSKAMSKLIIKHGVGK